MNERIKELITKAGGHWNYGDFNMPSSVEFQEQDIEKFAELIIRKCANIAFDHWCEGTNEESAEMSILKHFGVK